MATSRCRRGERAALKEGRNFYVKREKKKEDAAARTQERRGNGIRKKTLGEMGGGNLLVSIQSADTIRLKNKKKRQGGEKKRRGDLRR